MADEETNDQEEKNDQVETDEAKSGGASDESKAADIGTGGAVGDKGSDDFGAGGGAEQAPMSGGLPGPVPSRRRRLRADRPAIDVGRLAGRP